jgi:hypothetical protein
LWSRLPASRSPSSDSRSWIAFIVEIDLIADPDERRTVTFA